MKALIQRVRSAAVSVDGVVVGQIDMGVLAYIGICRDDDYITAKKLIDKIIAYRIFADEQGKLSKSLHEVGGGLLLVSQFTLVACTNKGRRPDFGHAMPPKLATVLFDDLIAYSKTVHKHVQTGQFGANMMVESVNDGSINFIIQV